MRKYTQEEYDAAFKAGCAKGYRNCLDDEQKADKDKSYDEGYRDGVLAAGVACGNSIVEYIRTTYQDASPLRIQTLRVRMEKAAKALIGGRYGGKAQKGGE